MNKWDVLLCVLLLAASFLIYFAGGMNQRDGQIANVYYDSRLVASLPLNVDDQLVLKKSRYQKLLADMEIEVKDGKVRIAKETSPHHVCSRQGWTDSPSYPLVCLPNDVYIEITSSNDSGSDATIS